MLPDVFVVGRTRSTSLDMLTMTKTLYGFLFLRIQVVLFLVVGLRRRSSAIISPPLKEFLVPPQIIILPTAVTANYWT